MADRIALMREGRIVQQGVPYLLYSAPADRQAAMFFSDVNVVPGRVHGGTVETVFGPFAAAEIGEGRAVEVVVRPQHLKMDFDRNGRGPLPTAQDGVPARARVVRSRFMGKLSIVELAVEADGAVLKATVPGVFLPQPETALWLSLRRDRCFVFPAA